MKIMHQLLIKLKNSIFNKNTTNANTEDNKPKVIRPTRNFDQYFEHVKSLGFMPGTVFDVGVANGTPALYRHFGNAYYFHFEPLPEFKESVEKIATRYGGECHFCALSDKEGTADIYKTNDLFGSSLLHKNRTKGNNVEEIKMRRLENIVSERLDRLDKPFLIKTDCQGGDLSVIKGAGRILKYAEIIIMEASLYKFRGNDHPDIYDIMKYMYENNYRLHDILDGLFRPYDNSLAQLDLVFVKEDGYFRKSTSW